MTTTRAASTQEEGMRSIISQEDYRHSNHRRTKMKVCQGTKRNTRQNYRHLQVINGGREGKVGRYKILMNLIRKERRLMSMLCCRNYAERVRKISIG